MEEEKIEELEPEKEEKVEGGGEPSTEEQPSEAPQEEKKIKIGEKEYTVEELQEALQKARDYEHLVPEFTRKSQRLAELERQLEALQATKKELEESPEKQAAKQVLKELGFVTIDEAQKMVNEAISQVIEDIQLEETLQYLEKKYDGSHGEPPFNRDEVLRFALEEYGDMDKIDLEYVYKKLHEDFWGRLPEKPSPKTPFTERGGAGKFTLPRKKITFEGEGKGEVSAEEAAKEFLKSQEVFEEE